MRINSVRMAYVIILLAVFLFVSEAADKDKQGKDKKKKEPKKSQSPEKDKSTLKPIKLSSSHQSKKSEEGNSPGGKSSTGAMGSPSKSDQAKKPTKKQQKSTLFSRFQRSMSGGGNHHHHRSGGQGRSTSLIQDWEERRHSSLHDSGGSQHEIPLEATAHSYQVSSPIMIPGTNAPLNFASSSQSANDPSLSPSQRMDSGTSRGSGGSRGSRISKGFSFGRSMSFPLWTGKSYSHLLKIMMESKNNVESINWNPGHFVKQAQKLLFLELLALKNSLLNELQACIDESCMERLSQFLFKLYVKAAEIHLHCNQQSEMIAFQNQHGANNPLIDQQQALNLLTIAGILFQQIKVLLGNLNHLKASKKLKTKKVVSVKSQGSQGNSVEKQKNQEQDHQIPFKMDSQNMQLLSISPRETPCLASRPLPCPLPPLFYGGQTFAKLFALHPQMLSGSPPASQAQSPYSSMGANSFPPFGNGTSKIQTKQSSPQNIYAIDQAGPSPPNLNASISSYQSSERLYAIGGYPSLQSQTQTGANRRSPSPHTRNQSLNRKGRPQQGFGSLNSQIYESMGNHPQPSSPEIQGTYQNIQVSQENPYQIPSQNSVFQQPVYAQIPQHFSSQSLKRSDSVGSGEYAEINQPDKQVSQLNIRQPGGNGSTQGSSPQGFVTQQGESNPVRTGGNRRNQPLPLGARPKVKSGFFGRDRRMGSSKSKASPSPQSQDQVDRGSIKVVQKLKRVPSLKGFAGLKWRGPKKENENENKKGEGEASPRSSSSLPRLVSQEQKQRGPKPSRHSSSLPRGPLPLPLLKQYLQPLKSKEDAKTFGKAAEVQQHSKLSLVGFFRRGSTRRHHQHHPSPSSGQSKIVSSPSQGSNQQDQPQKTTQTKKTTQTTPDPTPAPNKEISLVKSERSEQPRNELSSIKRYQHQLLLGISKASSDSLPARSSSLGHMKPPSQPVRSRPISWNGQTQTSKQKLNKP